MGNRNAYLLAGGTVFLLSACFLGLAVADEGHEAKAAAAALLRLADALEKDDRDAIKNETAKLQGMDLLPIMTAFKKRDSMPPGIGFGPEPGAYYPDGIEAQVLGMAKKELNKDALEKRAADIIRAAYITQAVAEVTFSKCPSPKLNNPWARFTQDMKDASKALSDAAKKGDARLVNVAAGKLNASCDNCHALVR